MFHAERFNKPESYHNNFFIIPKRKGTAHGMGLKALVDSYGKTGHDDIEYLRRIAHHISMM